MFGAYLVTRHPVRHSRRLSMRHLRIMVMARAVDRKIVTVACAESAVVRSAEYRYSVYIHVY